MGTTFRNPAQWLLEYFGGKGKVKVTAKSTLGTAPFWYGVNRISGNLGALPLDLMRHLDMDSDQGGSEKVRDHYASRLLRKRPNAYQTPLSFKQTETARAILWGNSRSYIHRRGRSSELLPLRPDATITGMVEGEKWHCTKPYLESGDDRVFTIPELLQEMENDPQGVVMIPDRDCLHIQGFGDGVCGLSLFQVAKQSLEISIGGDVRAGNQMNKGFAGKVMLEAPENSALFRDATQSEEFLKDFKEKHGADGATEEIGLLRGGVKANVMQMSNDDMQFIESRQFQRQEAALWLLLESILGDDSSVSYNSLEQKNLAYLINCLMTWLVRWEEECAYKLLSQREFNSGEYFFKFNTAALLKTDFPTTIETLSKAINAKIINRNEARSKIDMNPVDGGDEFENPAITPGNSSNNDESDDGDTNGAPNPGIVDRLKHMMGIEQKRVNQMLSDGKTLQQIDKWYQSWCETLGDCVENMGGERIVAQNHCVANLGYLKQQPERIDLAGSAEHLAREICNGV